MQIFNRVEQMSQYTFPDPELSDDEGLVAVGGDLSIACLLSAYRQGIFPWFNEGDPYLWFSPNPRAVLFPKKVYVSTSLKKRMKKYDVNVTINTQFEKVIQACRLPREPLVDTSQNDTSHTWITDEMADAYIAMHTSGHALSVETWYGQELVGGIYGVFIGQMFFGESMFSTKPNASKIALVTLCQEFSDKIQLIDCQMKTDHIMRMGAEIMPRKQFLNLVKRWV